MWSKENIYIALIC